MRLYLAEDIDHSIVTCKSSSLLNVSFTGGVLSVIVA